jgi:hypothetical protein
MPPKYSGQATLEYVLALIGIILLASLFISQVNHPIRTWWDTLARKVAAPCPTPECVEQVPKTVPAETE